MSYLVKVLELNFALITFTDLQVCYAVVAPDRPGSLSFIVTTPSSVLVSWTVPSPRPNGIILHYELAYYQDFRVDGEAAERCLVFVFFLLFARKNWKMNSRCINNQAHIFQTALLHRFSRTNFCRDVGGDLLASFIELRATGPFFI